MTDRIHSLTVVLDHDLRDDDCTPLIAAIEQIKGVASVVPHVVTGADYMARARIRREVGNRIVEAVREILNEPVSRDRG